MTSRDERSSKNGSATSEKASLPARSKPKQAVSEAANQWLAKNRSLVLRQTPVWAQAMSAILVALGTLGVLGGILFKIDEVVTVQGQLQSIGGSVEVRTPAGGQVDKVYFKDGDIVRKGQRLVSFDTRQAAKEASTLTIVIALEESGLQSRLQTIESQGQILESRKLVLAQKVATNETIVRELEKLVRSGGFQRVQYLQQLDQLLELRSQMNQVDEQISQLALQSNQIELDTKKNISDMRNRLLAARLQLQYQNVLAPVDGVVFDPKVIPQGVIPAGERIVTIVPQRGLYAEVFVPNKDIGFVKTGQSAKIRIDAFPFTRYGELRGTVVQVAADALPPDQISNFYRFPVKLQLDHSYLDARGTRIPLQSGMAITTNLKLREKRVISLISDLLVNQVDSVRSIRQQ